MGFRRLLGSGNDCTCILFIIILLLILCDDSEGPCGC